jgi:hypothetical protein
MAASSLGKQADAKTNNTKNAPAGSRGANAHHQSLNKAVYKAILNRGIREKKITPVKVGCTSIQLKEGVFKLDVTKVGGVFVGYKPKKS